jgi:hypothetical protein
MKFIALCCILSLWDFVPFARYEMFNNGVESTLRDLMLHTFLMRLHAFWLPHFRFNGVTSMHYIKLIRMFEDDVTWLEPSLLIQGGSLVGLGWLRDVCVMKNGCLLLAATVFWSGFLLPPSFLVRWLWMYSEFFSCDSVSFCFSLQRRPHSVGRRENYWYARK